MPSTATTRLRLEKQASGENDTTWGTRLNTNVIDMVDEAFGVSAFTLSGSKTLTATDYTSDESRPMVLNITSGTGGTVTIPNVARAYLVRNATSGTVTFTTGSGTTADVSTSQTQWVISAGSNVVYATSYPTLAAVQALLGTIASFNEATTAQFLANTADKALSTDQTWGAGASVALTDAATIALDMSTFINGTVTLGGNRTLGNPTNPKVGQSGWIAFTQDGTGSRTLAYSSNWEFANGTAPTLSTAAGTKDVLFYTVLSSTSILGNLVKAVA